MTIDCALTLKITQQLAPGTSIMIHTSYNLYATAYDQYILCLFALQLSHEISSSSSSHILQSHFKMEETPEQRRQRIAKLRAQRKQGNAIDTTAEYKLSDKATPVLEHDKIEEQQESHATQSEHNKPSNILQISGTETVEMVSKDIQDRIIQKSREIAQMAYDANINININELDEKQPLVHNKDLKESLGPQLKIAELQTNRVINQFLQKKIQNRLQD